MARFTAALGASAGQATKPITIEHRLVNLHRNENISDWYLLNINPKGQVPFMTVQGLASPITDSLDISYWFCQIYPRLLPEKHTPKIRSLLSQLHLIEALSLSAPRPEVPEEDLVDPACDEILKQADIGDEYRRALEHKKEVDRGHMLKGLYHENIDKAEEQAKALLETIAEDYRLYRDESPWLFGGEVGPTVLDGHVVPFITRLVQAGRARLIPGDLSQYAKHIVSLPQWLEVTHGRRTMWELSYGHVHLLADI